MSEMIVVSEKAFALYAKDAKVSALAIRISELMQKRTRQVDELSRLEAHVSLAQMHLRLTDFWLLTLSRERLELLEAP